MAQRREVPVPQPAPLPGGRAGVGASAVAITAFSVGTVVLATLAIAGQMLGLLPGGEAYPHVAHHSAIETAGAILALVLAATILAIRRDEGEEHLAWVGIALAVMGTLDLFHSMAPPGASFVWLHSAAGVAGGLLFSLVWLPARISRSPAAAAVRLAVVPAALAGGAVSLAGPGLLPVMLERGAFSATALAMNFLSGVLFLAAAAWFYRRFRRKRILDDVILANHCLLLGAAGFFFESSRLWDGPWWLWHVLRLLAYLLAATYMAIAYARTQGALRESEQRFRTLVENMPGAVYREAAGPPGGLLYVSESIRDVTGFEAAAFLGPDPERLRDLVLPEDATAVRHALAEAVACRRPWDTTYRIRDAAGEVRWLSDRGTGVFGRRGSALWLDGVVFDVTELMRAEGALARRERYFRTVADTATDAIISIDQESTVRMWNAAAERLFGFSHEEAVGKKLPFIMAEEVRRDHEAGLRRVLETGETKYIGGTYESVGRRRDGTLFPVEISLSRWTSDGETYFTGIIRDITERKQDEERLRSLAETQAVLLQEVNHRVKNNLAVITGLLRREEELARTSGRDDSGSSFRHLLGRIEGLSEVHSMLSTGGWGPIRLSELAERVVGAALRSAGGGVGLAVTPSEVQVDSDRAHNLAIVLAELALNSVKYAFGAVPEPRIGVAIEGRGPGRTAVVFRDNGPGFPEGALPEGLPSRPGAGLGLVRGIVTKSLRGTLSLRNDGGAVVEIAWGGTAQA